jgi:mono/diheme cytochrome c family protein
MNRISSIAVAAALLTVVACGTDKRKPGTVYIPDMAYSRAYETYADHSNLKEAGIQYNNLPVPGTVSRSEGYVYHLAADKPGDTANYYASRLTPNPITNLTKDELTETERLYLINCGICHGEKLDGNGPLWKDGAGPYPAKPATLKGDAKYEAMTAGTMFFSITHGRNLMGSYASQLSVEDRWKIVYYIKLKQGKLTQPAAVEMAATPAVVADSATQAAK